MMLSYHNTHLCIINLLWHRCGTMKRKEVKRNKGKKLNEENYKENYVIIFVNKSIELEQLK